MENKKNTHFVKYPKILVIGDKENENIFNDINDEIIIEEKIDGGNFRFMISKDTFLMGSRTRELDEDNKNTKNFARCMNFVRDKVVNKKDLIVSKGTFIFYGECCIMHSLAYDWDKIPPYLGFDVLDLNIGKFVDYDTKVELFKSLDLPIVPLIWRGKVKDFIDFIGEIDE